jgi:hypothetical protein
MPKEVFDKEEFIELSKKASNCTIKKNPNNTKLKLRTPRHLYTIVLKPEEATELIGRINCPKTEI